MTSLWFPVLTTLQVHRLLGWGGDTSPWGVPRSLQVPPLSLELLVQSQGQFLRLGERKHSQISL